MFMFYGKIVGKPWSFADQAATSVSFAQPQMDPDLALANLYPLTATPGTAKCPESLSYQPCRGWTDFCFAKAIHI